MDLIVLLAVGAGYYFYQQHAKANPVLPGQPKNYKPGQPSANYPFTATQAPRSDNKNQPWYANITSMLPGPAEQQVNSRLSALNGDAATLQATGSIVHSVSDLFGNLNNMFGGPAKVDTNIIASVDSTPPSPIIANNDTAPLSFDDQMAPNDYSTSGSGDEMYG